MFDFAFARARGTESQLAQRDIVNKCVIAAMGRVTPGAFIGSDLDEFAYQDGALSMAQPPDHLAAFHRRPDD